MNDIVRKTALITGASRGLGAAAARAFALEGGRVVLLARSKEKIEALASEIAAAGGHAIAIPCDVSDYAGVASAIEYTIKTFGRIDVLLNNAGVIEPISHVASSDPAAWARSIGINLIGAYNVVRAALPHMLAAGGGTIVNVSSGAAYRILEGWSAYCAGKAGLAMLTNAIALETTQAGIRVFGFSPGTIDTDMQAAIRASGMNPVSQIPRGELLPVADAVRGLLYLCGAEADDLRGQDVSMREDSFRVRIGLE